MRTSKERELALKREVRIRQARQSLWEYCKVESPDFYTENKFHLKIFCFVLQALYEKRLTKQLYIDFVKQHAPYWFYQVEVERVAAFSDRVFKKLMVNIPPRQGKSRTLVNFCKWAFGDNPRNKVITCSYNDDMASDFSRYTRDGITEGKTYPHEICYADVFPDTKIKRGNSGFEQWALEGSFFSYKGAGVGGSITGKGCNISIVDDPVKDAEEAFNENRLEKIWTWYTGTFLSRKEKDAIEIVNMTRWSKKDICGRVLSRKRADEWFVLKMEACYNNEHMLCEDLLPREMYDELHDNVDEMIFIANYHQEPVDVKGILYKQLKTYKELPKQFERIINYTDTADEGDDYLCSIAAGVYEGEAYILDVYYTKEGMEVTEPETADMLVRNNVNKAHIESNNGGRGFARNVKRIIWEKHHVKSVIIKWFHQSKNKKARILANSSFVMEHIYFPEDWKERWPVFYEDLTSFQKEGKNKHDDCADTITGIAEIVSKRGIDVLT